MDMSRLQSKFEKALFDTDKIRAAELFESYITENPPSGFFDDIAAGVLERIGDQWEAGEVSLAQVYMCSKICEELADRITCCNSVNRRITPKMAIATLADYHVLGKRIVGSILKSSGYDFIDYGHGILAEDLISKVIGDGIKILLISVLMYPSALKVRDVRDGLLENKADVRILVGGAPFRFDKNLWLKVGADAMAKKGAEGIQIIENWTREV